MKQINTLYKKLIESKDTSSGPTPKIDEKIRAKLHKTILDDLKKLRKKQHKADYIPEQYEQLDYEIRLRLLKEIQVILDEYVLANENNDLKSWKAMYGDIDYYIKNFFYYRMDAKYKDKKKILKDYKFLDEDLLST